jgi:CelD/BcsL family acetyltransferase involved in cellulose biosynthesis
MELKIHTNFPEELCLEWNLLLDKTATHVPFMRNEYLRLWWETRGGGEWPEDTQLLVVTAHEDGKLIGVAPFFYVPDWQGKPSLMLLGSVEISDYLDLVARPADLPAFLDALLPFLCKPGMPPWERIDLYNILDSSPTLLALEQAAARLGWKYKAEQLQHSPYIPLPGNWETYLAGIDKKQRHEIRRKMRRAEELGLPLRWYFVTDPAAVDSEIEDFMELMRMDEDKKRFLTPKMIQAFRKTVRCAFDEECLFLAFLEIGGKKAAGYLSFDYLNRIWVYNSGINWKDYSEYSPGWVLLGYLLQWANENQREAFDFMRGNEEYKYRFGAIDRFVMRAQLEP